MGEEILKAKHIDKSFEGRIVLNDLDLTVNQGDLIAIMGKSGSGKSTLLHILGTLDAADQGELLIAGQNPAKMTKNQLSDFRNQRIGFVFQFHHLLPEFDLLENVLMPGYIAKTEKQTLLRRGMELIDYFGLGGVLHQKPGQLSGGEQQRAAICRALINQPGLILADEPTGNLDQEASEELHRMFGKLRSTFNQSFVIVTHQQDLASFCDKTYILHEGKLHLKV
ncbi:MAG: ABC transporter ATP-binding protein [Saprospiraceae bacterium]|nr:ABC transporter ATP-binding protein [Saprospiraceae bacterium]